MHRFHRDLIGQQAVREELEALFERTKEQFYEIESFAEFSRALMQQLGDFLGSMTHRLEVDFEAYNPVNFFHALRLQPIQDGGVRAIEELGTGEQQILAIALAHAYANAFHAGVILVLEEPEAHLHPLAQSWLARRLGSLAEGGLQLLITTHSPHFVDLVNLEGLTLVRKTTAGATYVIQKSAEDLVHHCIASGVGTERITEENVLPFYDADATTGLKEGFFAKAVVLVEGSTEALALPVLLRKCGIDCAREGIAILSVDGKGNLAKWNRLFGMYDIPAYLVFDNDARDDASGNHRRDALRSLAIGPEGQEELIGATDWIVRDNVCVFGSNYEHIMRLNFGDYGELERQAQEERRLGSKPFIAKWVASRLNPNMEVGWERLRHLSEVVLVCSLEK